MKAKVVVEDIRLDLPDLLRGHLIEGQRRGDEELRGKGLVFADPISVLLVLHLEIIAVAAYKGRACLLDLLPEHLKRKIVDLMAGGGQLFHYTQCRICVPVGRYAEPCNLRTMQSSFSYLPDASVLKTSGVVCISIQILP